jgi:murein DD-endopeptidase MepM/ murein hydrolase activator NlpD
VRKATATPAVLWAVFTPIFLLSTAEARTSAIQAKRPSPAAAVNRARKSRTVISQNQSGEVVLERLEVVNLEYYGPPFPLEPHNYPQPLCEQVDTVVEVRLHDAEAGDLDAPEGESADVSREVVQSASPPGLTRIARKLGSIFRPKSSEARVRPEDVDLDVLLSQHLRIPVEGVDVEKLRDSFLSRRGRYAQHLAIDIGAPRGTPVLATADGEVLKVGREQRGGKSIYQKDATGKYLFFYCHLSRYADSLSVGRKIHRGDVIGYVGATGHVIGGPHLHFSITRVPEDGTSFRAGLAINPYLLFLAGVP